MLIWFQWAAPAPTLLCWGGGNDQEYWCNLSSLSSTAKRDGLLSKERARIQVPDLTKKTTRTLEQLNYDPERSSVPLFFFFGAVGSRSACWMGCQNDTQDLEFQIPRAAEIVAPNEKKGMRHAVFWNSGPTVDKCNAEVLASTLFFVATDFKTVPGWAHTVNLGLLLLLLLLLPHPTPKDAWPWSDFGLNRLQNTTGYESQMVPFWPWQPQTWHVW